jgi:hypothetical protein
MSYSLATSTIPYTLSLGCAMFPRGVDCHQTMHNMCTDITDFLTNLFSNHVYFIFLVVL